MSCDDGRVAMRATESQTDARSNLGVLRTKLTVDNGVLCICDSDENSSGTEWITFGGPAKAARISE